MSASEKLRALATRYDTIVGLTPREVHLIADVVRRVEIEHPKPHGYWAILPDGIELEECPTCAALTALQEHLEEK